MTNTGSFSSRIQNSKTQTQQNTCTDLMSWCDFTINAAFKKRKTTFQLDKKTKDNKEIENREFLLNELTSYVNLIIQSEGCVTICYKALKNL